MAVLFTTGYAGFDEESFVWKLRNAGVKLVIDVRQNPTSRNRLFSKAALEKMLSVHGFDYVHIEEFGVPVHLRHELRNNGDLQNYFSKFREHLQGQKDALAKLYRLVNERSCCLMCLERKPEECHRSVVAEVLTALNGTRVEVQHI